VTKTEFSTFTYFITSLSGLSTITSTDIVISSNVIGRVPAGLLQGYIRVTAG
jgi:hypothetical protein